MDFAKQHGLDFISTGGGYDFIYLNLGTDNTPNFTIRNPEWDDSPQSLDEPASVFFSVDHEWEAQDEYPFPSAREAITALANKNFRAAVVWEGQHLLDVAQHDVEQYIDNYHQYSESALSQIDALDLTYSQAAEFIITGHNTLPIVSGQQSSPSLN